MDREAYERGNSVYLVDRVIPMLPHRLSNGICSLNPGEDRLTMACEMESDANGHVVSHDIFQGVIDSSARLIYTEVYQMLVYRVEAVREKSDDYVVMYVCVEDLAAT